MKNNPNALSKILQGKLVMPQGMDNVYITADIYDPSEYIFIPTSSSLLKEMSILTNFMEMWLIVPGENDQPGVARCAVTDNKLYDANCFTWVGTEEQGCWAYYEKP